MNFTSKISRQKLDEKVSKYKSDLKTLEIGSYGQPSNASFFINRIGLDIRSGKGVDVIGSVYELPFPDNSFDFVLCMGILEHLEYPHAAIPEMHRVLKPGGRIIVSVPFLFPIHDAPNDFWRFTKYGLKVLFKDWEIEELTAETNFNETFATLFQRVGYQTKFYLNTIVKSIIFILANIIAKLPNMTRVVYGGIDKKVEEPEAFTSAFFLVARKVSKQ